MDVTICNLAVCGGGNGAHAVIPIARRNVRGRLTVYAPYADEAKRLEDGARVNEGIELVGLHQGLKGKPDRVSKTPQEVVAEAEMVLIVAPAFAHENMLREMAPYLKENVLLGAMPARSGFEYMASRILREAHKNHAVIFAMQTLPWACRLVGYGQKVKILGQKERVGVAAIPATAAPGVAELLTRLLGVEIYPMRHMLANSLANVGQIVHPGIMYGLFKNFSGETFMEDAIPLFYHGVDEDIVELLQRMSDEILQLTKSIQARFPGVRLDDVLPLKEWLRTSYAGSIADPSTLLTCFTTNRAYDGLKAPMRPTGTGFFVPDFTSRYLVEDVPMGLLVTRAIAQLAGVSTPIIDEVLAATSRWLQQEYLVSGKLVGKDLKPTRIPQNYGISSLEQLVQVTTQGWSLQLENGGAA
ncbi:hypothetical protein SY88_14755 [Clostridiales bacterium PH28_bin88]|nr:hypothetical protein SY88_14755 [Clostridiales bacterium PH28_bin88]